MMEHDTAILINPDILAKPVTHTKVELAQHLFESLESQVSLADRKVHAVFGLNAFLVAAISLQNQQKLGSMLQGGISINIAIDLFLKVLFLACVCIATYSAVKALTPRVKVDKNTNGHSSIFFFGDIRSRSFDQFSNAFTTLTNEEAVKELLVSAYSISGILKVKYQMLKRSTIFISIALLIWILLQVNKFLG